jgi:phage shock protein PspC (stress-responsive transcriptional regulator)
MPRLNIGITRSTTNRWVFGVCGGIAQQYGMNALAVRGATALLAIIIPGVSLFPTILLYIVLGLLLPADDEPLDVR